MRPMSGGVFEGITKRRSERVSRLIEHWRATRAVRILSGDIRQAKCRTSANAMQAMTMCAFT